MTEAGANRPGFHNFFRILKFPQPLESGRMLDYNVEKPLK